ncbi:MAG: hypothetical protein MUC29_00875, partial [Pyrinomonadaceae bacterium]|nr:hypothetical protein [Pyrinomonadaceae bacterium]
MTTNKIFQSDLFNDSKNNLQKGSASVIALLVMALLMGFVALAVSRTVSETVATTNDIAETKAFSAAQGSLENMTVNADQVFERKLSLNTQDVADIKNATPSNFPYGITFEQDLVQTQASQVIDSPYEIFQGLKTVRDE